MLGDEKTLNSKNIGDIKTSVKRRITQDGIFWTEEVFLYFHLRARLQRQV
jgi:hypothetical protein